MSPRTRYRRGDIVLVPCTIAEPKIYSDHEVTESRYCYSTSFGRFRTKHIEGTDAARDTLKQVLTTLDDTVAKGDPRLAAFYQMREIK